MSTQPLQWACERWLVCAMPHTVKRKWLSPKSSQKLLQWSQVYVVPNLRGELLNHLNYLDYLCTSQLSHLKFSEPCRWTSMFWLTASDRFWPLLTASDCFWPLLTVFYFFWLLVTASDCIWLIQTASDYFWDGQRWSEIVRDSQR